MDSDISGLVKYVDKARISLQHSIVNPAKLEGIMIGLYEYSNMVLLCLYSHMVIWLYSYMVMFLCRYTILYFAKHIAGMLWCEGNHVTSLLPCKEGLRRKKGGTAKEKEEGGLGRA
jgi:hypothetical protein